MTAPSLTLVPAAPAALHVIRFDVALGFPVADVGKLIGKIVVADATARRRCASTVFGLDTKEGASNQAGISNATVSLRVTGSPTGGSFTLTVAGHGTTAAIPYDAIPTQIQSALDAILGLAQCKVSGRGPVNTTAATIELFGALSGTAIAITSTPSLTGGTTPAAAVGASQVGGTTPGFDRSPTFSWGEIMLAAGSYTADLLDMSTGSEGASLLAAPVSFTVT